MLNVHPECIEQSRDELFLFSSINMLLESKFVSLFNNLAIKYESRLNKHNFKLSRVLWPLFQQLCYERERRSWSWSLSQSKGTRINGAVPHRPTSHYPSLYLPPSLHLSLSLSLSASLFSPTQFQGFLSTSGCLCLSLESLSLLPASLSFPVGAVMGLKDACDVIQTDCSSMSGMLLPPLLPAAPIHLHPPPSCSQTQVGIPSVPPLCLSGSAVLVFHLLIEDVR